MTFAYLSLIKPSVLNGAVWFVERLKGVGHVPVPQSGLLLIGDAEQLPHLVLYHVCGEHNKRHSFSLKPSSGCGGGARAYPSSVAQAGVHPGQILHKYD